MNRELSSTRFFQLSTLAFVALATPVIAVSMRGLVGFFPLAAIAVAIGFGEGSINRVLGNIRKNVAENKLLAFLIVWYFIGILANQYYYLGFRAEWRLLAGRSVLILGVLYIFGFAHDEKCRRYLQIFFLFALGLQAVFSIGVLAETIGIARDKWTETRGAWIHGNQTSYANSTLLLPILIWRSFKESGILKLLLLGASIVIGVYTSISTFGTPLGLIILGIAIVPVLSLLLLGTRKSAFLAFAVGFVLILTLYFGYKYVFYHPLLSGANERIENVILDPESGGYSGDRMYEGSRWYLNQISLNTFFSHPYFGEGGTTTLNPHLGGHSAFFDLLGGYGLLGGGGAFIGIVLLILRNASIRFWRERDWQTLLELTTIILYSIVGIVNQYWEGMAFILVMSMAHPFKESIRNRLITYHLKETNQLSNRPLRELKPY